MMSRLVSGFMVVSHIISGSFSPRPLERSILYKVVICTDADVDGYQIRTLILTMLYRLCPTLIQEGYVYIAESPLFEINCGDKTWFAYSEKEKGEIVKKLEGKKYKIDRSKGLGETLPRAESPSTI